MPYVDPLQPLHPRHRTRTRHGFLVLVIRNGQARLVCGHGESRLVSLKDVENITSVCDECVKLWEERQKELAAIYALCMTNRKAT
jgi:hypothetical protein